MALGWDTLVVTANHSDMCITKGVNRMHICMGGDNFRKKNISQFDQQTVCIGKPRCSKPTQ